jgi:hypothetical protein
MKYLFPAVLAVILVFQPPSRAGAQDVRRIVLHPSLGPVVDSAAAVRYQLFNGYADFRSVVVDQMPDSTFRITVRRSVGDTAYPVTYSFLALSAERVGHWADLENGTYTMGSNPARLEYADGGFVPVPPEPVRPRRLPNNRLPLSADSAGFARPLFFEFRFGFSTGLGAIDFSNLADINTAGNSLSIPLAFYLQLPLSTMPSITVAVGGGYTINPASQGSMWTTSAFVIYRMVSAGAFRPVLGAGGGYLAYASDQQFIVRIRQAYPLILAGVNVIPDMMDVVAVVPLAGGMNTTFKNKPYTIRPATASLNLLLTF